MKRFLISNRLGENLTTLGEAWSLIAVLWTRLVYRTLTEMQLFLRFWWVYAIGVGLMVVGLTLEIRRTIAEETKHDTTRPN